MASDTQADNGAPQPDGGRGSHAPAIMLCLFLSILVVVTVWTFLARPYPAPPPITSQGLQVDRQFDLTLYATGAVFVLAQLGIAYAVLRFRDRGQVAHYTHGNITIEVLWIVLTFTLFVGLGVLGSQAWSAARLAPAAAGSVQIEVTENQFVFNFRYPGPDGRFGRLDPSLISAPTGNPLGLDPNDPAGKDDVVLPTLTVPVNRPVELLLRSQDVIHNFFVRELRLQQDAVPGMVIPLRFTANRIGRYEIVCTQLCGLGHYKMRSFLHVVSGSDYQNFLNRPAAQP